MAALPGRFFQVQYKKSLMIINNKKTTAKENI
jgi:hypothetical protein